MCKTRTLPENFFIILMYWLHESSIHGMGDKTIFRHNYGNFSRNLLKS